MNIKLSINRNLINKGNAWTDGWVNAEMSEEELLNHVREGYAFSQAVLKPGVGTKKPEKTDVQEAWLICVDIDNAVSTYNKETKKQDKRIKTVAEGYYSIDDVKADSFVNSYGMFVYTTPNHTPDWNRFRIVFLLNEPVCNSEDYTKFSQILIKKFDSDKSCSNIERLWYGSRGCRYRFIGKSISLSDLLEIEKQPEEHAKEEFRYKQSNLNGNISEALASEMLECIPGSSLDYYSWFSIVSAVGNYFNESAALRLIDNWSPDTKTGTQYKLQHRASKYNIGTLVYYAKMYGFDTNLVYGRLPDAVQTQQKVNALLQKERTGQPIDVPENKSPFKYPLTEAGNAERFIAQCKDNAIYNHTSQLWHIWNGYKWEIDLKRHILNLALTATRNMVNELAELKAYFEKMNIKLDKEQEKLFLAHMSKSESKAKLDNMLHLATAQIGAIHSEFDKDLYLINCLNGTYNLETNIFQPCNPQNLITKSIDVNYDPEINCFEWDAFLETIFDGNYELIDFVQRAVGVSLCGAQLEEVLFFCYGTGKNGKSVFFNILNHIFGDYFQKAPTEMLMLKHNESIPNDIARLPGARMVVAEELPENRTLNENKIKNLTGGDMISARFLHKEFFDFKPTYKLWIYGNHKPNIKGTDEGIWRRICLIPFLVTIPEEKRIPQNILIKSLLDEKSGIFNWILDGWKKYQKDGLKKPDLVKKYTNEYRLEQDIVADFVQECCLFSEHFKITKAELLDFYVKWCQKNNEHPAKRNTFYKRIENINGISSDVGTGNAKIFKGIKLQENGAFNESAF